MKAIEGCDVIVRMPNQEEQMKAIDGLRRRLVELASLLRGPVANEIEAPSPAEESPATCEDEEKTPSSEG
jgi:hypothetical protein